MTTGTLSRCFFYTPYGVTSFGTIPNFMAQSMLGVEFLYALRRDFVWNSLEAPPDW